jgi:hypothetical protein
VEQSKLYLAIGGIFIAEFKAIVALILDETHENTQERHNKIFDNGGNK